MLRWACSILSAAAAVLVIALAPACGGGGGGGSTPPPPEPDMYVDGWYITQSAQTYARGVPLIADRDGFLRIFVRANTTNIWVPVVRVTINAGTPAILATPSGVNATDGVPTGLFQGDLTHSWNMAVPGSLISSGMRVRIELDPDGLIEEGNEVNNLVDAAPAVRTAKVFATTIIPVIQSGLEGNVDNDRTLADWVDRLQHMYPIRNLPGGVDVQKGATYTTTADLNTGASPAADQAGWEQLLAELEAKRIAEASTRYYFGAVAVEYPSGIAGLGYRPINPSDSRYRSALGWDKTGYSDGGNYPEILAHEVGHNFGRSHAPCGSPSDVDPSWPKSAAYASGAIGIYGYDVASNLLKLPTVYKDIMTYCDPLWVSDYTYKGIMNFRDSSTIGDVVGAERQECLLVWGRVTQGEVALEPAFKVITTPQLPSPGSHTLQLQDAQGNALFETTFEPVEIADLPGEAVKHFAFAVPLKQSTESSLRGMRVLEKGRLRAACSSPGMAAKVAGVREPASIRMRAGEAHLSWDPMAHPKAIVRDPRSGEVLSIAGGGSVDVVTDATELDVTFSDGVNSTRKLLKVQ